MISNFGDQVTADIYHGENTRGTKKFPPDIIQRARNKLDMLNAAVQVQDLQTPPGNRLECLKGNYNGWYSIRVNRQWRIIFRWEKGCAKDVKICDYH